jgi:hypothetical protein
VEAGRSGEQDREQLGGAVMESQPASSTAMPREA